MRRRRESSSEGSADRQKETNPENSESSSHREKNPGECEAVTDKTLHEYLAAKLKLQNTKQKKSR